MVRLPEHIRDPLEKFVKKLSTKETVSGVGLFGSWSRGDATSTSDLDLLIIDNRNFSCEYVNRVSLKGKLIDLNYIPRNWLSDLFPLEIDQKLHEAYVLYDRDWSLTNTKDWLVRVYRNSHRIDLRTEHCVVESDIFLNKAISAYQQNDFQSACIFAEAAAEFVVKALMEINCMPISNSHFIKSLEESTAKLGMPHIFSTFLTVTRLSGVNHDEAERRLELFKKVWDDLSSCMRKRRSVVDSLPFRVQANLKYYGDPNFLCGIVARAREIIAEENYTEASHYLLSSLFSIVENYVPLISAWKKTKFSYAPFISIMRSFEGSAQMSSNVVAAFGLNGIDSREARELLRTAKELTRDVRRWRKVLIDWFVR